jgi:nitrogen fixation/metabolism regulation signal transduction histidine kinase
MIQTQFRLTSYRPKDYNQSMTFRSKMSLVIFLVTLLPTLAVIFFSAYLLNSTLNRMGAAGLENSLQTADALIEQTRQAWGRQLVSRLSTDSGIWDTQGGIESWRKTNNVDLAFEIKVDSIRLTTSDSIPADIFSINNLNIDDEFSRLEIGDKCFLIFSQKVSTIRIGGGILMPSGYGQYGQNLANSIAASASLGMYRAFSLKLLAIVMVIAIALSLLLGIILSATISRQLAKPLEKLALGAKVIGAGNLDYQVSITGNDEFSRLADSFNKMTGEIKDNQRRLLESERLAAWREVARRIAHEIKNPLTPINIQLYRLQEKLQEEQSDISSETLQSLETIRSQIDTLANLAQHFSTFAKEPELKLIRYSIGDIIKESTNIFGSVQNLEIVIDLQNDIPPLNLDPQMMRRALANLIKNSLEASPVGAKVEIKAQVSDGHVNLTIRDNGPGFPLEKLDRIDQPYITSKRTGTGLGLVIVKKIIEEHAGHIRFFNDHGAVAEIRLPI